MPSSEELYLDHLDSQAGTEARIQRITEEDVWPPVFVITYADIPEAGMLTSFTAGLSSVGNPDPKDLRHELVISVQSTDSSWGLAIGYVAARARGQFGFHIGDTVNFKAQIADESEMSAFVINCPSIMDREQALLTLPDRTISIVQMYPIYEGEMELIRTEGPEAFWSADVDLYDVRREDTSKSHSDGS